jgi:hypothetical protein
MDDKLGPHVPLRVVFFPLSSSAVARVHCSFQPRFQSDFAHLGHPGRRPGYLSEIVHLFLGGCFWSKCDAIQRTRFFQAVTGHPGGCVVLPTILVCGCPTPADVLPKSSLQAAPPTASEPAPEAAKTRQIASRIDNLSSGRGRTYPRKEKDDAASEAGGKARH